MKLLNPTFGKVIGPIVGTGNKGDITVVVALLVPPVPVTVAIIINGLL